MVAVYFSGALLGSVTLGCPWIRDVWQGRAASVAGELARRLIEAAGESDVPKEHPLRAVRDATHYLRTPTKSITRGTVGKGFPALAGC